MSRPAFIPLVRGLPARVEGVPLQTLSGNPTLWANSLRKTLALGRFDGLVAGFDSTLLLEALGCPVQWRDDRPQVRGEASRLNPEPLRSPRLAAFLQACRQLFPVIGHSLVCMVALSGPLSLADGLFGPGQAQQRLGEVKQPLLRVLEELCALRPDGVIFMERRPSAGAGTSPPIRRIYNAPRNILSHYQVLFGLYVEGGDRPGLGPLEELAFDFHIEGPCRPAKGGEPCPPFRPREGEMGVGIGLPLDEPAEARRIMSLAIAERRQRGGGNFFLTSQGPMTRETDLERLNHLVTEISQVSI